MPVSSSLVRIEPQGGVALRLAARQRLCIVDPYGEQVADVALFDASDVRDAFSPGRTMDYNESLRLGVGDILYSHRSVALARVVEDTVGVHDLLLAPCSEAMFARRGELAHRSCHENLTEALKPFGIPSEMVAATVNVFMNVRVEADGHIAILPPRSRAGDVFAFEALCNLIVGITACSSERTNNGRCKPICFAVVEPSGALPERT
ncbi:MAG: urea carboxylase-associated family protein [Candidatus Eremiobacteraeota bacterium]|nr:urea carboxylase-associated family protein [Candidatus Eremiobacteraeota bacterium]